MDEKIYVDELVELAKAQEAYKNLIETGTMLELANAAENEINVYLDDEDADLTPIENALGILERIKELAQKG